VTAARAFGARGIGFTAKEGYTAKDAKDAKEDRGSSPGGALASVVRTVAAFAGARAINADPVSGFLRVLRVLRGKAFLRGERRLLKHRTEPCVSGMRIE